MKKWVLMFFSFVMMLMLAGTGTAEEAQGAGHAAYTVEFTSEGRQYVMPGDSSVRLSEILEAVGLTGEAEAVTISDPGLFSASNATGEWVVTAHRAFNTAEWMKVAINGVTYEITVTDDSDSQSYAVIIGAGIENGTVTANPASAAEGATVTLGVVPGEGCLPESLSYTPEGGTPITVQADESGVYSFTMPAGDVTVNATFRVAATPWEKLQAQLNAGGEVTLNDDVTADEGEAGLIVPGGVSVTLDLNGHVINRGLTAKTDDGYVIKVGQNGNLTVVDSAPDAIHDPEITYTDPMDSTRIVTVTGGVITGGNNANGGGVYNMGTFSLSGGAISGNKAQDGGGVYSFDTFTMTGGTISGNCCYLSGDLSVGGVYSEGTFTMTGGAISGNGAADYYGANSYGGVYFSGTFKVSGDAKVTGNSFQQRVSNVYVLRDSVITIDGTLASDAQFGVTTQANPTQGKPVVFTSGLSNYGTAANFTSDFDNYYRVRVNDSDEAELFVPQFYSVTIDAENGKVTANRTGAAAGDVITLTDEPAACYALASLSYTGPDGNNVDITEGKSFIMPAGNVTVTAVFASEWVELYKAIGSADSGAKIDVSHFDKDGDRRIACPANGSALEIDKKITLDLQGCVLDRHLASAVEDGYAIHITGSGNLTLVDDASDATHDPAITYTDPVTNQSVTVNGGVVTGGNTANDGGGVYNEGVFTMRGGTISGNTANGGGGVYNAGTFTMSDSASVTGNTAASDGGGVYQHENVGEFKVSGRVKVTGNRGKDVDGSVVTNNVYLPTDKTIIADGPLASAAQFGVTTGALPTSSRPVVFTSGLSGNGAAANFTSDSDAYRVRVNENNGAAELYVPAAFYSVNIQPADYGTVTANRTTAAEGDAITLTDEPVACYALTSLSYTYAPEGESETTIPVQADESGVYSFTMPAGNVTVTAVFASEWVELYNAISSATSGAEIDVSVYDTDHDGRIACPANGHALEIDKELTLDLHGCVLNRHLASPVEGGYVIHVGGNGDLTVIDNDSTATHDPAITYTNPVTGESETVNGGVITGGNNEVNGGGVYVAENGALTLSGGTVCGNSAEVYGGGVYVAENGAFTLSGGAISGNSGECGGAVSVSGGSLAMTDGTISGNTAYTTGGGVFVMCANLGEGDNSQQNAASFTMSGGTIENNTVGFAGGGVYINGGDSTFTMSGTALVTGNKILKDTDGYGGGACIYGKFDMSGGTISDNTAYDGGGVYISSESQWMRMSDGTISGNTAYTTGGGVSAEGARFTMSGGAISGNNASKGGGLYAGGVSGTFTVNGSPTITGNTEGAGDSARASNVFLIEGTAITVGGALGNATSIGVTMQTPPGAFTSGWAANMPNADPTQYFTSDSADFDVRPGDGSEAMLKRAYVVTVANVPNGGVQAKVNNKTVTRAVEGETVVLEAQPDSGYVLAGLAYTYTPEGGTPTTTNVYADDSGVYSFTMPAASVTVNAAFMTPWEVLQQRFNHASDDEDNPTVITLTENVTALETDIALEIPVEKYVVLDLNGFAINRGLAEAKEKGNVITVNGSLTVTDGSTNHDGKITGGNNNGNIGFSGGVYVAGGSFTLSGGTVCGNVANRGGGVYVAGGSFTLSGGEVSGNTAMSYGGGVCVVGGSFTLSGGTVCGNAANRGGGVYVDSAVLSLSGGEVNRNTAELGGGVYFVDGTFELSGSPTVSGNKRGTGASAADDNVYLANDGKIAVAGALANTPLIGVTMQTPGVFTSGWASYMGTADPAENFTSENAGYNVYRDASGEARLSVPYAVTVDQAIEHGSVTVSPERQDGMYGTGETVTLLATPSDGYAFNSYTVTDADGQAVAVSENNTFTMPAGNVTVTATFSQWKWLQEEMAKGGTITLARDITCDDQTLGPLVVPGGVTLELDLNGHILDRGLGTSTGTPTGNVISVFGNLTVEDSAPSTTHEPSITYTDPIHSNTVTVTGGVITGGNATQYRSGGVYIYGIGSFTLNGGAISGNSAEFGGGVSLYRGSFTLNGGAISGNSAQYRGGGVNVNEGSFTLAGGEVRGNTNGGVNFITGVNNSFKVKGSGKVTGNKESDIYLNSGRKITVDGILNDDAEIVVSMPATGVFTEGYREIMGDADPAQYFTSRLSGWNVYLDAEGEARLSTPYTVSVGTFTGGSVALVPARSDNKYGTGETVTLTITPAAGYIPDTLTVKQGDNTVIVTDNQFTMPAGNVTVSATFQPIPATAPTIGTQPGDLSLIYGYTTGNVLSVEASAADGHTLSYQWYSNTNDTNEGGTAIPGAAEASYTVPAGRSAGTTEYYYCVVTATRTDNSQTANTTSNAATVSIGKATPTISTAPTASAITYGQTLAGSTLTDGTASVDGSFAWKDSNVAPAVSDSQTTEYDVVFTPTDANYGTAACKVKLTVNKARAAVTTAPTASTITYGQTLAGSALTGGTASVDGSFAWKDSNIAPAVSDSQTTEYDVVFTPTDGNYATAACKVKLTVNKAGAAVTTAPTAKTLRYTGSAQELVTTGTASGGTMQYALGTSAEATGAYSATIPTATNAGTFYVWYKVVGDTNHTDTAAECAVTVIVPVFGPATFILPAGVRTIEANAFEGLPMTIVKIPSGCTSIGANAFKDCANLTQIRIPASVTSIDTTAFDGCVGVFIYGTINSAAQTFCADHANCTFVAEN